MRCQSHVYTFGGALGMLIFIFMSFAPFHGFLIQAICEILPKKYPAEKSSELFMLVYALFFAFAAIVSGDILIMAASVPALSAISGRRLDLWLNTKNLSGVRVPVILNILILIPVLYILIPFTINHFPVIRGSLMSLIPYGITSGLFLFACWYYTKTRQLKKWIRNVLAAALLCLMPLAGVFNLTAEIYSVRDIGLKLRDLVKGSDIVIQYGVNYPSVYFYSLRNSKIINAKLTPGTQEKNFAAKKTIITELWNKNERIFLIVPEKMRISGVLPKNIFHITESDGTLLLSNK